MNSTTPLSTQNNDLPQNEEKLVLNTQPTENLSLKERFFRLKGRFILTS